MPQLDPTFYLSQVLWLVMMFLVLWSFMHWKVVPLLYSLQSQREKALENIIQEAQHFQQQAEAVLQGTYEILETAKEDALKLIEEATMMSQQKIQASLKKTQDLYQSQLEAFQLEYKEKNLTSDIQSIAPDLLNLCLKHWQKNG